MCCRVLPQKNLCCLVILSPFKKSALYTFVLFWGQGFSLGQDKIRSGFHTGHGWFFLPSSSSVCFWVPLVSQISAVVCLGWLKSALRFCGRRFAPGFFCGLAPPLCGCFLGFRGSVGRRLAVFFFVLSLSLSLSLVSCCSFRFFLVFGAATLFLMPRPLMR